MRGRARRSALRGRGQFLSWFPGPSWTHLRFLNMMKGKVVREREEVRSDWWDDDTRVRS